jgi:hypothetical protein
MQNGCQTIVSSGSVVSQGSSFIILSSLGVMVDGGTSGRSV